MNELINLKKNIALFLSALLFLSSCVSSTTIISRPPGARVFVNNEYLGETPVVYSDTKIAFSTNMVTLEKEGYEPLHTTFSRSEEPEVGAIVAAFFSFFIPLLWVTKYKSSRTYELVPLSNTSRELRSESDAKVMDSEALPSTTTSRSEQLRELKKLLDEGILTQEEFEAEKKKILEQK